MSAASDSRVCDTCANFEVSPCGCSEHCHAALKDPEWIDAEYSALRVAGDAAVCKGYIKVHAMFESIN